MLVVISIIVILAAILFPVFVRARANAQRAACQSNLKQLGLAFAQYNQDNDGRFPHGWDVNPLSAAGTSNVYSAMPTDTTDDPILWPAKVLPYLKSRQIFHCPSFDYKYGSSCTTPVGTTTRYRWQDSDPVNSASRPSAGSFTHYGASFVHYGYNVVFLGGDTYVGGHACQDNPPTNGIGALESQIEAPASMVLLIDNNVANRGITVAPAFAVPTVYGFDLAGAHQCKADGTVDDYDTFDGRHFDGVNVLFVDGHVKWMKKEDALYRPAGYVTTCNVGTNWNSTDPRYIWNRK
jgi:prepilin-type processing-associated H-X9-DG protein